MAVVAVAIHWGRRMAVREAMARDPISRAWTRFCVTLIGALEAAGGGPMGLPLAHGLQRNGLKEPQEVSLFTWALGMTPAAVEGWAAQGLGPQQAGPPDHLGLWLSNTLMP